jgi:hypothetical protein
MNAPHILAMAKHAGISIALDGDDLVLKASALTDPDLLELLKCHKAEIVSLLRSGNGWTDEDWQALFDERAGIMEFDGGSARAEAEARAADEVARLRTLVGPSDE